MNDIKLRMLWDQVIMQFSANIYNYYTDMYNIEKMN